MRHCGIREDKERKLHINMKTRDYLNEYELYNNNDIDLQKEECKYIDKKSIDKYLQTVGNKHGYTVSKDIAKLLCLGMEYHLKDMFDEMEKWREKRVQQQKYIIKMNIK